MCVFKDRVVDDLNPGLNFTRKEVESLLHFVEEEAGQFNLAIQEDFEEVIYQACKLYPHLITKVQLYLLLMCSFEINCSSAKKNLQNISRKTHLKDDFSFYQIYFFWSNPLSTWFSSDSLVLLLFVSLGTFSS